MGAERARINNPRLFPFIGTAQRWTRRFPDTQPLQPFNRWDSLPVRFSWALSAPGQAACAFYRNSATLDAPVFRHAALSAVQQMGFAPVRFFMGAERARPNSPRFLSQQRIAGRAVSPTRSPFGRSTDGIRSRPFFMGAERARINSPHLPLTPAPAASARRTARRRRIPESYRNAPRANAACRRAHPARRGRNSNAVRR